MTRFSCADCGCEDFNILQMDGKISDDGTALEVTLVAKCVNCFDTMHLVDSYTFDYTLTWGMHTRRGDFDKITMGENT